MAGRLKYTLVRVNPDGVATPLLAGEAVPEWAADLVHDDDFEDASDRKAAREAEKAAKAQADEDEAIRKDAEKAAADAKAKADEAAAAKASKPGPAGK